MKTAEKSSRTHRVDFNSGIAYQNSKKTSTYSIWCGMRQRCLNPGASRYDRYGGRGISICSRWDSFANFLFDMGEKPDGMTIERIDNNKGYSPDNCKWVSKKENLRNTSQTHFIEFNGERMCLTAWAEKIGIKPRTLSSRIFGSKWAIEKALTTKLLPNFGK